MLLLPFKTQANCKSNYYAFDMYSNIYQQDKTIQEVFGSYNCGGRGIIGSLPKPRVEEIMVSGKVVVSITINEQGHVIAAVITIGTTTSNQVLRNASVEAAKKARFIEVEGQGLQQGTITYLFESSATSQNNDNSYEKHVIRHETIQTSQNYYKDSKFFNHDCNLLWPVAVEKGDVKELQKALIKAFYPDAQCTQFMDAVDNYWASGNRIFVLPEYDGETEIYYMSNEIGIREETDRTISYYTLYTNIMAGGSIHASVRESKFVNFDKKDGRVLTFSNIFSTIYDLKKKIKKHPATVMAGITEQDMIGNNIQFAILKDSVLFHFGSDMLELKDISVTIASKDLIDVLTAKGKEVLNLKIRSLMPPIFHSEDWRTFGLYGKVRSVYTDEYALANIYSLYKDEVTDYNWIDIENEGMFHPEFSKDGKLNNSNVSGISRDYKDRIESLEIGLIEYDTSDFMKYSYYEDGRLFREIVSPDNFTQYFYDDDGNMSEMVIYKNGEPEYSFLFSIISVDGFGNWTERIVRRFENGVDCNELSKEVRTIEYW